MRMRLTKIYRIECPINGEGVFSSLPKGLEYSKAFHEVRNKVHVFVTDSKLRTPVSDLYMKQYCTFLNENYFCACSSMEKLLKWVPIEMMKVLMEAYDIIEISIPSKLLMKSISGNQVFYKKEDIVSTSILNEKIEI